MSENQGEVTLPAAKTTKAKVEVTSVTMKDGTVVEFPGKRNLLKSFEVLPSGEVKGTFAFRTGDLLTFEVEPTDPLYAQLAGHGLVQKAGDETSGIKDEAGQPDVPSMVMAVESILARLGNKEASVEERWFAEVAAGDSFSGASVVVRALMEAKADLAREKGRPEEEVAAIARDQASVKAFLDKRLAEGKNDVPPLTRQKLFAAFRKPGTRTAPIIERLEKEKAAGTASTVDANAELEAALG